MPGVAHRLPRRSAGGGADADDWLVREVHGDLVVHQGAVEPNGMRGPRSSGCSAPYVREVERPPLLAAPELPGGGVGVLVVQLVGDLDEER